MREALGCFACGPHNPIGLHLEFAPEAGGLRAEFTLGPEYQGYEGVVHGGIVAAALDDAMANLAHASGRETVTARLEIRYRREAPIGRRLVVTSALVRDRGRVFAAEAHLTLPDGTVLADARGTFVRVR